MRGPLVAVYDAMAEDKGRVMPTNSKAYLKILRKLVELWRGASAGIPADGVMNKSPVKKRSEQGTSRGSKRDQTHHDASKK
jgi:hypothetical protein